MCSGPARSESGHLRIVVCTPVYAGPTRQYCESMVALCQWSAARGHELVYRARSSPVVALARAACLGASSRGGARQVPFGGEAYDAILWIDADIVFRPEQAEQLLARDAPIVAGLYRVVGGRHYAAAHWDEVHFRACGEMPMLPVGSVAGSDLVRVAYAGMGFMVVRPGVFEAMEYPWFAPMRVRVGDCQDLCMEDVAFCLRAARAGFPVQVDPAVVVGHVKSVVL